MARKAVLRLGVAVLVSLAGARESGAQAARDTTHHGSPTPDTSATAYDTTGTYTTLDGLGLGRIIPASLSDVQIRVRTALLQMKIVQESDRPLGLGAREIRGKKGLADVSVRFRSQSPSTTRIEVTVLSGPTNPDKGLADQILDAIQKGK
jgi:hypothetical protein